MYSSAQTAVDEYPFDLPVAKYHLFASAYSLHQQRITVATKTPTTEPIRTHFDHRVVGISPGARTKKVAYFKS